MYSPEATGSGDIDYLLERAHEQIQQADSEEKLNALISTYEAILAIEPDHRATLTNLCSYYTLLGAGYTLDRSDKAYTYEQALRYCEQAMYLNPAFKERVDLGESLWDASIVLIAGDADAMGYWVTAVLYYFKEVVPDPLKAFDARWLTRARIVMERIEVVDPAWSGGANFFNLGIYYLATPKSMGGDLDKAEEYFAKAASSGPDWLLTPWGKAKYYYPLTGDRQAFDRDLEWVLARKPGEAGEPYPWSIYFRKQARELQAQGDELF
jgi:tetratricopeptide (TPR) repeat protein